MADDCNSCAPSQAKDWAGDWRTLAGLWGVPGALMLAAGLLGAMPRAVVWTSMLTWMAAACFANARRCGRTHCRITAPFFLAMAVLVVGYTAGIVPLGEYGWFILGGVAVVGNAVLWWGSERAWGTFS